MEARRWRWDGGRNTAGELSDKGGEEVRGVDDADRRVVLQEGPHRRIRSASVFPNCLTERIRRSLGLFNLLLLDDLRRVVPTTGHEPVR